MNVGYGPCMHSKRGAHYKIPDKEDILKYNVNNECRSLKVMQINLLLKLVDIGNEFHKGK